MATQTNSYKPALRLVDMLSAFWRGKWIILSVTGIAGIISIFLTLKMPDVYYSQATLIPSEVDDLQDVGSQFGGLASLAGISIGSQSSSRNQIALEIMGSQHFLAEFIKNRVILEELMAAENWDMASNTLIYNRDVYDMDSASWVRKVDFPFTPEPNEVEAVNKFKSLMTVEKDPASGVVKIGVEFVSPHLAKSWVEWLVEDINRIMKERDKKHAEKSIQYLESQLTDSQYANLKTLFYGLVEEQLKTIMLAEVSPEYVFTVIDPPIASIFKSGPQRGLIVVIVMFLAGLVSSIVTVVFLTASFSGNDG